VTLEGTAQSLLRRRGRLAWRGDGRRRPPGGRRGFFVLAVCVVALLVVPQALADQTSTTPAPDPNPPPGAAPDPYTPPAKAPAPKTTPAPAPVHTVTHVYTPPAQTVPAQHVTPQAVTPVTPARPPVVHHAAKRVVHKARHRAHKRHVVVHHKKKPVVVRVTPRADVYVSSLNAAVALPSDGLVRRRRTAGVALAALCATSLSMLWLGRRAARERLR